MHPIAAEPYVLRPFAPGDVDEIVVAARQSVSTVGRWMPWRHADYTAAEAEQWIAHTAKCLADHSAYELAVVSSREGVLVGGIGLNQFNRDHNFCNLGYWVRESWQRRGATSAAVRAIAQFGFGQLKVSRIEIVIQQGNVASQRVAEKVGALREGIARNRLLIRGQPRAAIVYSLVP